ncbi:MAG: hypothetical protein LBH67_02740 [Rickettsia sp.]|jgi:hypothetical protein|nr:hypothetical protein [Rickettsia sp.]
MSYSNYRIAINYCTKAQEILDSVKGYDYHKWTVPFNLAQSNLALGQVQEAEKNIQIIE